MKTQKEIETIKNTYEISEILNNLFSKYKNYDSTIEEHYDPSTIFGNKAISNTINNVNNTNVSLIEYKESLFKKILNRIKQIFTR